MTTKKRHFAEVVQLILVITLLVSMVLIGQQFSKDLYRFGMILLVVATVSQIAFGNIPPTAGIGRSMRMYVWFVFVTAVIFAISIVAAPYLVGLGR